MSQTRVDDEIARISERIRRWREEEGLTLQELAKRSGVATSTIQKIETAQMIPSVAVLLKVARGLGRRPTELIHDGSDELEVIHLQAAERHPVGVRESVLVERLSGELFEPSLEMWRITLQPGATSGRGSIEYEGEELLVCEQGTVTVELGESAYTVRAGDSLHFKASIPHRWMNEGRSQARFLVVGTLPRLFRAAMHARLGGRGRRTPALEGSPARSRTR